MNTRETAYNFMKKHGHTLDSIDSQRAAAVLKKEIIRGLEGKGPLPMYRTFLPAYRPASSVPQCITVDVGGTTLRTARATADENGVMTLSEIRKRPVPGLGREISESEFFTELTEFADISDPAIPVAVSWSYNMESLPQYDARMLGWCKEIAVTQPSGRTVAQNIRHASHLPELSVSVINDSAAVSMSHAGPPESASGVLGLILGTGFNICCPFVLDGAATLINTECGESHAFAKSSFEKAVIAESSRASAAHAEKQCSGVYLEKIIRFVLGTMQFEGLIRDAGKYRSCDLASLSSLRVETQTDELVSAALYEAEKRAAGIAAMSAAAFVDIIKDDFEHLTIVTEGSVINKMPGFYGLFEEILMGSLSGDTAVTVTAGSESCLIGAAAVCGAY